MPDNLLWAPSASAIEASNLSAFAASVGFSSRDYGELHRWSVENREAFWRAVWDFTGIVGDAGDTVLEDGDRFPGSRWFPNASLNYAENLLRHRDDHVALIAVNESGARDAYTYRELASASAKLAAELAELGVGPGDRVAGWLPNVPGTVVAMLATASLGAVWSSCSPDFGFDGALDRFGQIEPKVLIGCDGYRYNGRSYSTVDNVERIAEAVNSIETVLWVSQTGEREGGLAQILGHRTETEPQFARLPFDHPLYIMYSSGTTGKPKCIVHGAGGTLLQHAKEHQLHVDLRREDVLFFFTTCGWMMWNWLVSGLATGCTLVLYEGSPFKPSPSALIDLIDRERITVFGVGAKYIASIEKAGVRPIENHELGTLKTILSTGSPLTHESFRYVYQAFKPDVWLASISGGTDLISCFVLGNPWAGVREGEIQGPGLAMAVNVFDESGHPIVGAKGELVCTASFPSTPIGFWNDPADAAFRAAYFERFDEVWAHGDFAEITESGGYVIHGRSDAVLNPGGVRIGTAEIYRQVESIVEIREALCVGQEWEGDTRVVLFVVMQDGAAFTREVASHIRRRIRENATPRHVPSKIVPVPDIPRTMSGKIAEIAVREVVHGRPVKNTSALANPEVLAYFEGISDLES